MDSVGSYFGLVGAGGAAVMWLVHTVRHRQHLSQCVQDLQRHRRLDRRLVGCVTEMEWILDDLPAAASAAEIPEELVGHARYLFGLRQEAADNAARQAFDALVNATREYERGLAIALLNSGDGSSARALAMPVRLLDESSTNPRRMRSRGCERCARGP